MSKLFSDFVFFDHFPLSLVRHSLVCCCGVKLNGQTISKKKMYEAVNVNLVMYYIEKVLGLATDTRKKSDTWVSLNAQTEQVFKVVLNYLT